MANILDYLDWRGDITLAQSAFNPIDSLILSVIAYIPFENIVSEAFTAKGIPFHEAAQHLQKIRNTFTSERIQKHIDLFIKAASANRFAAFRLSGYCNHFDKNREMQFAAVTITCTDGTHYAAFRGTDATLIGWKEDFNMSFMTPVPAQQQACQYLEAAAGKIWGKFRTGGHSKGGNLAVYASAFCKPNVQRRILAVYNNDGPGFDESIIARPEFQAISNRLLAFIPQSSIIGMLLEHAEQYTIVESVHRGIAQHDPYSWSVLGTNFICKDTITDTSKFLDTTIKNWLKGLTPQEREKFIDALFSILEATGVSSFSELSTNWFQRAKTAGEALKNLDAETKTMILKTLKLLVDAAAQTITKQLVVSRSL